MSKCFPIHFSPTQVAQAVQFDQEEELQGAIELLKLPSHRPVLVLVGGASGMTPDYLENLKGFFIQVICQLMEELQGIVIDGGTDAGVMQLMGQTRYHTGSTFPLVGVAAHGTVCWPYQNPPALEDYAQLEPYHTHFLLAPGFLWGDESPWIARTANHLAEASPSITLLINGGRIAWQDVSNSVSVHRPVLVLGGSGRTADELRNALEGDRQNQRANQLVDSGLISTIPLTAGFSALKDHLCQKLAVIS